MAQNNIRREFIRSCNLTGAKHEDKFMARCIYLENDQLQLDDVNYLIVDTITG